jgi:hypothetical protein
LSLQIAKFYGLEKMKVNMVIIDEMALTRYSENGSNLLMRLLERVDENISVAFTSNRELSASLWVQRFIRHIHLRRRLVFNQRRMPQLHLTDTDTTKPTAPHY